MVNYIELGNIYHKSFTKKYSRIRFTLYPKFLYSIHLIYCKCKSSIPHFFPKAFQLIIFVISTKSKLNLKVKTCLCFYVDYVICCEAHRYIILILWCIFEHAIFWTILNHDLSRIWWMIRKSLKATIIYRKTTYANSGQEVDLSNQNISFTIIIFSLCTFLIHIHIFLIPSILSSL